METPSDMTIPGLEAAYEHGQLTPDEVVQHLMIVIRSEKGMFICRASAEQLKDRIRELYAEDKKGPLWGVPFAVKDNIDVAGYPTTAACPDFSYTPEHSAPCVQTLLDAGGIMVGKTNMDQFATGLVGTRTPYGVARNAFDSRFIPGGSSSGSGTAVGQGLVSFALGTDTAGSGRIPAAFNGCVGLKPTLGRVSTTGVVPACRSLDCVTVFAHTVADAAAVVKLMQEGGEKLADPNWRPPPKGVPLSPSGPIDGFRFAIPGAEHLNFRGPGGDPSKKAYEKLFKEAVERLKGMGGELADVDFGPFADTAQLLYESAFVAERASGVRTFLEGGRGHELSRETLEVDSRLEKVIGAIYGGACKYNAVDVYDDLARLRTLRAKARVIFDQIEVLMVPTALHHYLVSEIEGQERNPKGITWSFNANLGRFTNFVNQLDLCGIAIPSGVLRTPPEITAPALLNFLGEPLEPEDPAAEGRRMLLSGQPPPKLPFGITLLGPAWTDEFLCQLAEEFVSRSGLKSGPAGHGVEPYRE